MPATATRKTSKHVCTFEELSPSAKENAREWMRNCERQDFDTEFMFEDAKNIGKIFGIEFDTTNRGELDIRYSGFCSQGSGASFVGSYSHGPNSPTKIREYAPEDKELHAIADGLDVLQCGYKLLTGRRFTARITQDDNRYVHKYTMQVDLLDDDAPNLEDGFLDIELEKRVLDLMRDFAQWIYDGLEKEYDYRTSDEAIEETIRANEYTFQVATGKVV